MADKNEDYPVGYRKPPKAHRFRKGTSGNPEGRPKGSPNVVTAITRALNEKVVVTEAGRRKTISKLDAAAKQLANKAASGDLRAAQQLLGLIPLLDQNAAAAASAALPPAEADKQVMASIVARIQKLSGPRPDAATPERDEEN